MDNKRVGASALPFLLDFSLLQAEESPSLCRGCTLGIVDCSIWICGKSNDERQNIQIDEALSEYLKCFVLKL